MSKPFGPAQCHLPPTPAPAAIGANDASFIDLARSTSAYAQAWSRLVVSETRLASASAVRLLLAALILPALAFGIFITVNALVAAELQRWLHDWASGITVVLLLDIFGLCGLLLAMRRWWRNLSLPRSRNALIQMLRRAG